MRSSQEIFETNIIEKIYADRIDYLGHNFNKYDLFIENKMNELPDNFTETMCGKLNSKNLNNNNRSNNEQEYGKRFQLCDQGNKFI